MNEETYLGDGLYCSFDGWQFTLRAPRADGDHYVCLEPAVFRDFITFARLCGVAVHASFLIETTKGDGQ